MSSLVESFIVDKETHTIFHFLLGGILSYVLVIFVEIYPRNRQESVWKSGRITVAVSMMRVLSGSTCLRKKISLSLR
jgi:hypothetical protein